MELKSGINFQENAKEYVINMVGNRRMLHRKNGCPSAQHLSEYYDFDSYLEAKQSGIQFLECGHCFKEKR